MKDNSFVSF